MKKRITSIIIAVTVLLSCAFVVPSTMHNNDCFAKSKTKYIKVKKTTYNKYREAYKAQTEMKLTISEQKVEILELKDTIKSKKQTISWLWSTLEENGFYYNYDTHKWEKVSQDYTEYAEEHAKDYYESEEPEEHTKPSEEIEEE